MTVSGVGAVLSAGALVAAGAVDVAGGNTLANVLSQVKRGGAVAACGLARRALVEGHTFAQHRRAFSNPIAKYPSVQEILARMKLSVMCALCSTFRILAMSDLIDTGQLAHVAFAEAIVAVKHMLGENPLPIDHWVKWLGNVSAVALVIGGILLLIGIVSEQITSLMFARRERN